MRDLPAALGCLALTVSLALASACGSRESGPADAAWPAGALLSADRAALASVLDGLAALERTPLAREAAALRAALPDCDAVEASALRVHELHGAIRCAAPTGALAGLHDHRGAADVALVLPRSEASRAILLAQARPEQLTIELTLPDSGEDALAALLPGGEPAGPPVLSGEGRLAHLRVKSDALDLASLVPADSQGDQLFRLKSALFSKALLDDTWELAIYPPREGEAMPRVAAALGVRTREAADAALERFLSELEAAWSLRREPFPYAAGGVCLPELRLMPELAPCALATERALVLAWNAASLRQALDAATGTQAVDAAAHFEIDLARLQQTDARLAASVDASHPVTVWPWRQARGRGERRGDAVHVTIELTGSES